MENIMDKTDLEEKYEIALNKMYFTLHKIIKLLEEEKETHETIFQLETMKLYMHLQQI